MRGRMPVTGATVRWSLPAAGPSVEINGQQVDAATTVDLDTGAEGLCEVDWAIDAGAPPGAHQVQAGLLSASGTGEGPAVVFTAGFRAGRSGRAVPDPAAHGHPAARPEGRPHGPGG